jgi:antitoxin component YwqK of YwqJK toxin-antitoxin module
MNKRPKAKLLNSFMLLLLSLLAGACAASLNRPQDEALRTISIVDRNGMTETINNPERIKQYQGVNFLAPQPYEKVYRIHSRTKEGNIPSFLHSYHENGQPKQYLEVVNSRALGNYYEWYPNGSLRLQANVIGGDADLGAEAQKTWIFEGHAYAWDEIGYLKADISYQKGALNGDSIYYHPNGRIWRKVPFFEGRIHGTVEIFLDSGQLFQRAEYRQGELDGKSLRYWNSQQIAAEEDYRQNSLLSGKYFDVNGNLVSEVKDGNGYQAAFGKTGVAELHEIRNGSLEGEVKIFGTDNKPLRRFSVKNNIKHGEEIEYYELPHLRHIPKLLVTWYEGKIQGIAKTWYDNGVQESNREMSNNAKNGISTAWYRDGSLMLIEEYAQDKLAKGEYFRRAEKTPISAVRDGKGVATLFDPEGNFINKIYYENGIPASTD